MSGGIQEINKNTKKVAMVAYEMLAHKMHWNGRLAVKIYGWHDVIMQGPIIAFNLLRGDGSYTGYAETEKMANLFGIDLRTGCFCNSGACQKYLDLTNDQLSQIFEDGKECGDSRDIIDGRPTGAVRISFGRQSTREDVAALEQMIDCCFLGNQSSFHFDQPVKISNYSSVISCLVVYPVKSCRGIRCKKSYLTKLGLRFDRIFMIECCGLTLTQKRHQKLCKIATTVSSLKIRGSSCYVTV
uniref:MOSC_N domain-containing protein n=1 Tax=Angiostrongylus cantonensis TaxID=6313 RepID=A0A0K0D715_ANGCA